MALSGDTIAAPTRIRAPNPSHGSTPGPRAARDPPSAVDDKTYGPRESSREFGIYAREFCIYARNPPSAAAPSSR
jgi:hypothetical protein